MHLPHEKTIKYAEKASHGLKEYKRLLKDDLLEVRRYTTYREGRPWSQGLEEYIRLLKEDQLEAKNQSCYLDSTTAA